MWGVSKRRGRGRGGAGAGAETGAYLFCKESCFKVGVDTNPALILNPNYYHNSNPNPNPNPQQHSLKKTIDPDPVFY